jgi:two-component system response regulator HydG
MRAEELVLKDLLELDPEGGVIKFAGQRALLLDAVAMGLLRKYLVENFGVIAARTVLTQFGFAHGWRMAEAIKADFTWDTADDLRAAGTRIHALEGFFAVKQGCRGPLSPEGAVLLSCYEAEQHLLHFGRADSAVCWTISGLQSGYLSRSTGKEVYVLEDRCMGKGDAACHILGRTREEWGEERAGDLHFFEPSRLKECLDVSLRRVTDTLKAAEKKLREQRRAVIRLAPDIEDPLRIIAKSTAMRQAVDLARRVAHVDSTVLITGESGTGKERIARLIHAESSRAAGPFIAINCGAITETLLESELFGHVRGAFTGATADRVGLFEAANTGTLLLDEVGEISPSMQVKLLRVLQEREVRRVGDNLVRPIDLRVLAATNRDITPGTDGVTFREDLYYRLKVIEIPIPPLRERRDDVLPLARLLLADSATRMKRSVLPLAPAVADQLLRHPWPGNVRELENAMERAAALARGARVELDDLPEEVRHPATEASPAARGQRTLEEVEREHILATLEANDGNQVRTAEQLQIGSATLYRKLKSWGLINARRSAAAGSG